MNVLAFAASLRRTSLNRKLIALAAEVAERRARRCDPRGVPRVRARPIYDGDASTRARGCLAAGSS